MDPIRSLKNTCWDDSGCGRNVSFGKKRLMRWSAPFLDQSSHFFALRFCFLEEWSHENTRSKEFLAQDSRKKAFLAVMRKALPSTFWLPAVRRSTQSDRLCQGGFLLWELSRRTQDAENCPSGSSWCCPAEPQTALAWSHHYKVHKPEGNHRLLHPAQVKVVNTSPGDSDNHE